MLILSEYEYGDGYIFIDDNKVKIVRVSNNIILYSLLLKLRRKEYLRRSSTFAKVKLEEELFLNL